MVSILMGVGVSIPLIFHQFHLPVGKILVQGPESLALRIGELQLFSKEFLALLVKLVDLLLGLGHQ